MVFDILLVGSIVGGAVALVLLVIAAFAFIFKNEQRVVNTAAFGFFACVGLAGLGLMMNKDFDGVQMRWSYVAAFFGLTLGQYTHMLSQRFRLVVVAAVAGLGSGLLLEQMAYFVDDATQYWLFTIAVGAGAAGTLVTLIPSPKETTLVYNVIAFIVSGILGIVLALLFLTGPSGAAWGTLTQERYGVIITLMIYACISVLAALVSMRGGLKPEYSGMLSSQLNEAERKVRGRRRGYDAY
jgi:hypothetical protein